MTSLLLFPDHQGGDGEGWQLPPTGRQTVPRLQDPLPSAQEDPELHSHAQVLRQETKNFLPVGRLIDCFI